MSTNLFELLQGQIGFSEQERANVRYFGVYTAIVSNHQDPKKLGRVKVKYPWLADDVESDWARVVCLGAGKDHGLHYMPEVDDEVLVAFEHGDVEHPYVLGGMWNGKDKIPLDGDGANKDNNIKRWRTRSGHDLTWDDTDGKEKITFEDKTDKRQIIFDVKEKKWILNNLDGNIEIHAPEGDVLIDCKTLTIKVKEDMSTTVGGKQDWKVTKDCTWKVDGNTSHTTAKNHDIKVNAAMTIKADATMDVKASANMTIKGAMVLIN